MQQRTIRYGLTTALRPVLLPEEWTGTVQTTTTGCEASQNYNQSSHALLAGEQPRTHAGYVIRKATTQATIVHTVSGAVARHTTITVEAHTEVTILETIQGEGTYAGTTTLILEPGAKVHYATLQNMNSRSTALVALETELAKATLTITQAVLSAGVTQLVSYASVGQDATIETRQVVIGSQQAQIDAHASTVHVGAHSVSNMITRGILDDNSRALFHGLIRINPESHDVDSYQKTEAMILSDAAGADAIPNLEIHDHRVRCSHGASIGRLDTETLFYLMSRGISETEAKRMITEGFILPLLPEAWVDTVHAVLSRRESATQLHDQ